MTPAYAAVETSTYLANGNANDSTSTHHGTWSGTEQYSPGVSGAAGDQAFNLNGGSRILMDGQVGLFRTEDARISFSFKTTNTQNQSLVGKRRFCGNPSEGWWDIRMSPSNVSVEFGGENYASVGVSRSTADGAWHSVVVTRRATRLSISVDGVTASTNTPAVDVNNPGTRMGINSSPCINQDTTRNFVGQMDNLIVRKGPLDDDNDGVPDVSDNCPSLANSDQLNTDGDGQGDACDEDDDNDGTPDDDDAFPNDSNESADNDGDGAGDDADTDDDNDGTVDDEDAFPNDSNESADNDGDGTGDNADADDDNDGVADDADNCPNDANPDQQNTDGDEQGNVCDADDDNDGDADGNDNCPLVPNPNQQDTDGDGQGDLCDATPGNIPGKVSGGGFLTQGDANFSFTSKYAADMAAPTGNVNYQDKSAEVHLKSTAITSSIITGSHATIRGTGTVNGVAVEFRIETDDLGEPGKTDTFSIEWLGYSRGGVISGGNIQMHKN